MTRELAVWMLICVASLGLCSLAPAQAPPPSKKVALVVKAYRRMKDLKDDLAAQTTASFSNGPRDLAKELLRQGWTASHWASERPNNPPPAAEETPTEENLRAYLKGLAAREPEDQVLVVLVGPLISLADKDRQRLYFCPQDAQYPGLTKVAEVKAEHHLLPLEDIYAYLKACPARRKLLVLVTALSTTYRKPERYPSPVCSHLPELPTPPANVPVWTSCAPGEFTSDSAHFLEAMQEGLAGFKADGALEADHRDGAVTLGELHAYTHAAVQKRLERLRIPQNPTVLGRLPRDWVLAGKAADSRWRLLTAPVSPKEAQQGQAEVARRLKLQEPVVRTKLGLKLVVIPPGSFRLGSDNGYEDERPRPRIVLPRPYFLGQHEVTQEQYQQVMGTNPSSFSNVPGQDRGAIPVETVTFKQAVLFCNGLSEQEGLSPYYRLLHPRKDAKSGRVLDFADYVPTGGQGYRLPTEAEWEWACRAGTETPYSVGDKLDGTQANVDAGRPGGVKPGAYLGQPTRVGSFAPNAWGLYDMHGNVAERVEESYDPRRYKELMATVTDGSGGVGYGGLARGGAWNFPPQDCTSSVRVALGPDVALKWVGVRVARDAE